MSEVNEVTNQSPEPGLDINPDQFWIETDQRRKKINNVVNQVAYQSYRSRPMGGIDYALEGIKAPAQGLANFTLGIGRLADDTAEAVGIGSLFEDEDLKPAKMTRTWGGDMAAGITEFSTAFIPVAGGLGKLSKLAGLGRVATYTVTNVVGGAVTDFALDDGEASLSDALKKFATDHDMPTIASLAGTFAESDGETKFESRLKRAAEGVPLGITGDLFMKAVGSLGRALFLKKAGQGELAKKSWEEGLSALQKSQEIDRLWSAVEKQAPRISRDEFEGSLYRRVRAAQAVDPNAGIDDVLKRIEITGLDDDGVLQVGLHQEAKPDIIDELRGETAKINEQVKTREQADAQGAVEDRLSARDAASQEPEVPVTPETIGALEDGAADIEFRRFADADDIPSSRIIGITRQIEKDRTIIGLHRDANVLTLVEELTHDFFLTTWDRLPQATKDILGKVLGFDSKLVSLAVASDATRPFHEKLAQEMLAFVMDGRSGIKELEPFFEQFAVAARAAYDAFDKPAVAASMTPEVRALYEALIARRKLEPLAAAVAASVPRGAGGSLNQTVTKSQPETRTFYHYSRGDRSTTGLSREYAGTGSVGEEASRIRYDSKTGRAVPESAAVHLYTVGATPEYLVAGPASHLHVIEGNYKLLKVGSAANEAINTELAKKGQRGMVAFQRLAQKMGYDGIEDPTRHMVQLWRDVKSTEIKKVSPVSGPINERLLPSGHRPVDLDYELSRELSDKIVAGGVTYSPHTKTYPTEGFAVSPYKGRETKIPLAEFDELALRDFVEANQDLLSNVDNSIGAWVDDGVVYLDVTRVVNDKSEALRLAKASDQLGVGDLGKYAKGENGFIPTNDKVYVVTDEMLPPDLRGKLTKEQLAKIKGPDRLERVVHAFRNELPAAAELEALARVGSSTKGGYEQFSKLLGGLFGRDAGDKIALLNAAFSAQQEVGRHLSDALRMYKIWNKFNGMQAMNAKQAERLWRMFLKDDKGAVARSTGHRPNVLAILQNPTPSVINDGAFAKSVNFSRNNMGDLSVGTFDTHMAKLVNVTTRGKLGPQEILHLQKQWVRHPYNYLAYQARVKEVADRLGWEVAEVQEAAWSAVIAIARLKRITGKDGNYILENLRHEAVAQAWNAAETLKGNPDVRRQLTSLGITEELIGRLAREASGDTGEQVANATGRAVRDTDREVVGRVASRLAPSSGLTGRHINFGDLAQRVGLVPADLQRKLSADLVESLRQDKLSFSAALDAALEPVNMRRVGLGNDYKAALKQLEDGLIEEHARVNGGVKTNEITAEEADHLAEVLGTGPEAFKFMSNVSAGVKDLAVRATAVRKIYSKVTQDLVEAAKAFVTNPEARPALRDAMRKWAAASSYRKNASTEIGRALQSFNIVATPVEAALNSNEVVRVLESGSDTLLEAKIMRALAAAGDDRQVTKVMRDIDSWSSRNINKFWALHNEFWINSMLSGVRTHTTNFASQAIMTVLFPANRIARGVATMNTGSIAAGLRLYGNLLGQFRDMFEVAMMAKRLDPDSAIGKAVSAWKTETPIIDSALKTETRVKAWSPEFLEMKPGTVQASAMKWLGNAIRLPSRFLTGADEFFKQINYRAFAREEGWQAAIDSGLKPATAEFNEFLDRYVAEAFTKEGQALSDSALLMAEKSTFTQPFAENSIVTKLQELTAEHQWLKLFIPFVRVPANIMKTFRDYTPGLNFMFKEFRAELRSADKAIAEDAQGRLALGVAFWSVALAAAYSGKITGGGPKDPELRNNLMATGWRPYSFQTDDGEYIEYRRIEPFATLFGLVSDFVDISKNSDEPTTEAVTMAMAVALAKNLSSKTYLNALTETMTVLTNPDPSAKKWIQQRLSSYIPNAVGTFPSDNLHEARTYADAVLRKIPGYAEGLPPKRDLFGEKIATPPGWLPWGSESTIANIASPARFSRKVDSVVKDELAKLQYGFSHPPKIAGGVDLTQVTNGKQDAYDRWLELHGTVSIGGKTMDQALDALIKSDRYQRLPEPVSADDQYNGRVREVRSVIGRYRDAAFRKTLSEYPQISKLRLLVETARRQSQTPSPSERLLQQIAG